MTRRGGQLAWGSNRSSMYSSRNNPQRRNALLLVAGVLALAVIVFIMWKLLTGTSCEREYCATGQGIDPPDGYERLTKVFKVKEGVIVPADQQLQVQLPLNKSTTDGRNLSFYRYTPEAGAWEPLAAATLDPEGQKAFALLNSAPQYIAVMRRLSAAGHVVGYLAHNAFLHPEAAGLVTIVHTRDFKPVSDGSISGEPTAPAITTAPVDGSVAFYPVLFGEAGEGTFLPIMTSILASSGARSNHVQQIVKTVVEKQLAGIDIDYRDLTPDPETRSSFALLIFELAGALHAQNKVLTVTLPAPIRVQDRIDEGAYDWAEIGKAADIVKMWPMRDQSTYRRDMPAILEYLAGRVPSAKLVFTVSPYSTEKSSPTDVHPIALTDAMSIATKMGIQGEKLTTGTSVRIVADNINRADGRSGIAWQPETATVAFSYEQNGGRTIWIENLFSVGFKLEFISRFGLGGVAVEDASGSTAVANLWPALAPFIATGQPILQQPNPADLQPLWGASKGEGEQGDRGAVFTWSTPTEPGTYSITLTVSDGVARFENELSVSVQRKETLPTGTPTATATAR